METLSFSIENLSNKCQGNNDVVSSFKHKSKDEMLIRQGMSINEISDVVSDVIIESVLKQFETTANKNK